MTRATMQMAQDYLERIKELEQELKRKKVKSMPTTSSTI